MGKTKTNNGGAPTVFAEQQEREADELDDLVVAKLRLAWQEIAFLKRLSKIPVAERDEIVLERAFRFAAAIADDHQMTREEFLGVMGEAFDAEMSSGVGDDPVVAAVTRAASRGIVDNPLATLEPKMGAAFDAKPSSLPMPPGVYEVTRADPGSTLGVGDRVKFEDLDASVRKLEEDLGIAEPPDPLLQVHDTPAAAASFKRATAMLLDREEEKK